VQVDGVAMRERFCGGPARAAPRVGNSAMSVAHRPMKEF